MMFETISLDVADSRAVLTLNRPEVLNALSPEMIAELSEAIEMVRKDDRLRALVLKGAGRAFCSGDDLTRLEANFQRGLNFGFKGPWDVQTRLKESYLKIVKDLLQLRKPVVAAVHGYTVGSGLDIALACDFRIAAQGTKLGATSITRAVAGEGAYLLPRFVGLGRAREMLYLGDLIGAEEALRLSLVNGIVPADELEKATQELAEKLAKLPTRSIGSVKTARNQGLGVDYQKGLEYQAYAFSEILDSAEPAEGIDAFLK